MRGMKKTLLILMIGVLMILSFPVLSKSDLIDEEIIEEIDARQGSFAELYSDFLNSEVWRRDRNMERAVDADFLDNVIPDEMYKAVYFQYSWDNNGPIKDQYLIMASIVVSDEPFTLEMYKGEHENQGSRFKGRLVINTHKPLDILPENRQYFQIHTMESKQFHSFREVDVYGRYIVLGYSDVPFYDMVVLVPYDVAETPNDPNPPGNANRFLYVTSGTKFYIDPDLFFRDVEDISNYDYGNIYSKGYKRVQFHLESGSRSIYLGARNITNLNSTYHIDIDPFLYVNKWEIHGIDEFYLQVYAWTEEDFPRDNPATGTPEGYSVKLQPIKFSFTETPDTRPKPTDPKPVVPSPPTANWDVVGWLMYIVDWLIYIVEGLVYMLKMLGDLIGSLFRSMDGMLGILTTAFAFLPSEVVSIIVMAILISVIASIFARR